VLINKLNLSFLIILDLGSKYLVYRYLPHLAVLNRGIAFGLFRDYSIPLIIFICIILILLIWSRNKIGLGLDFIIAGAVSNLITRFLFNGYVLDFLQIGSIHFNLADCFVIVGLILFNNEHKNTLRRRLSASN